MPQTLLLKHRDIIVGKLQATEISDEQGALLVGGFVIAENHQDSQQGQLLLVEALSRFRERGYGAAVAITASERAGELFQQNGAVAWTGGSWPAKLLANARQRYHVDERDQVRLFFWPG